VQEYRLLFQQVEYPLLVQGAIGGIESEIDCRYRPQFHAAQAKHRRDCLRFRICAAVFALEKYPGARQNQKLHDNEKRGGACVKHP